MRFRASFEDVSEIRDLLHEVKGKLFRPVWKDKCLCFSYEGGDTMRRSLAIHLHPLPAEVKGNTVRFDISLKPNEIKPIRISFAIAESEEQPNRCSPRRAFTETCMLSLRALRRPPSNG